MESKTEYTNMPAFPSTALIFLLISSFFVSVGHLQAQDFQRFDAKATVQGNELKNPWTGGLNAPQFSEIDLNDDGFKDLFVFDRVGHVILTFIYTPGNGYTYEPQWIERFPNLENWALLRDFNGDGIEDIFTYSFDPGAHSVKVYRGERDQNGLRFERMKFGFGPHDVLYYPGNNNFPINLLVTNIDIPAIGDIDNDGDLDILSFSLSGGLVVYYQNQSIEKGYGRDSLIFELEDDCWGKFYESGFSNEVTLSPDPERCAIDLVSGPGQVRHAGSTLLTFDSDGDNDKELVLGDISFNFMVFLLNGGNTQEAFMISQDTAFPSKTVSVDLPIFPAGFQIDIDHDNKMDLLVSPNNISSIQDNQNVWFYQDQSATDIPSLELVQKDFLVGDMVEVGTGSQPAFADVNADGLVDLIVGNNTFYKSFGEKDSRLLLYLNTGNAGTPEFTLTDADFLTFSAFSTGSNPSFYFAPTFGDLDNDGDLDLMVGERWGSLFYAENIAGKDNPMAFAPIQTNFLGDEPFGQSITPLLIDLNGDGLTDIVAGERNGNLNYFQNIGTPGNPQFNFDATQLPNTDRLGNVDTRELGYFTGHSAPVFLETENGPVLLVGSESRGIIQYEEITNNLYSSFTEVVDENMGGITEGANIRLATADLDNDGYQELIVGNNRGGLSLFNSPFREESTSINNKVGGVKSAQVFPNPARTELYIIIPGQKTDKSARLKLFGADGKIVANMELGGPTYSLNISSLADGFYFGKMTIEAIDYYFRFVKK